MHAASLTSPRLRRVLAVLKDGRRYTTRTIMRRASVCAVNTCVAELRELGACIECTKERVGGKWRWFYRMTEAPKDA